MRASARSGVFFAARGGSNGRALGSLAAPAVALLDIPSVRLLHVCFDGVRAESLCGGCLGRGDNGDTGLRDRQMADEEARGGRDGSARKRRSAILGLARLKDLACAGQGGLGTDVAPGLRTT